MTQTALDEFDYAPEPVEGIFKFRPDGATCAECGETVEVLWTDGEGGMVCETCKSW